MADTKSIHVLNGPNLNLLGSREPEIYGTTTLEDIVNGLHTLADKQDAHLTCCQSNSESQLIDWLHDAGEAADGVIINPAGYSHTSVALRDAVSSLSVPVIEVHLSNIHARESFRHTSLITPVSTGAIVGLGAHGYGLALEALLAILRG